MKKIYTLLLLFTITLFYSIPTQAFDIPLNYDVSDNDQAFVQTKNLFDKDTAILGFIGADGSIGSSSASFYHPDYIPIEAGQTITISASVTTIRIAFYDASQTFIIRNAVSGITTLTSTAPANTKFFRVSGSTAQINSFQVERGSTATSYAAYGFLSLNDIFVDGQFLLNPTFDDGTNNWNANGGTITVSNSVLTFTSSSLSSFRGITQTAVETLNEVYYAVARIKPIKNSVITLGRDQLNYNVNPNVYNIISNKYISDNVNFVFFQSLAATETFQLDYVYSYALTYLGIDHLTVIELDLLYNDWFYNSIYDQGFTDGELSSEAYANGFTAGYEVGYGDGYTDAVEEDNAYALGFAKGLLEGTDMETGSSLLILIVAFIGFVMMIFGFTTKRGIFNLLSVGAFVVLGTLLVQFVGFVIIAIGLVLINIYYAFFGDL
jgi:hypothetical protein